MEASRTHRVQHIANNGQIIPFDPGTVFRQMRIQERQQHIDGYLYRVETPEGIRVLYETPAYFQAPWQNKVWQAVQESMETQGLWMGADCFFQYTWQKVTLNYVLYPEWVWQARQAPVAAQCWQAGLLPEQTLQDIYNTLRHLQRQLVEKGWVNPSLVLPHLFFSPQDALPIALDWSCAVPINQDLVYPRFFKGYHQDGSTDPIELAWQGAYHSFVGLLMGRSPHFWAPEPISTQSIHTLLSPEMRAWLKDWQVQMHPQQWPDLPTRLYNPQADTSTYQQASQHFNLAFSAYQDRQLEMARHHAGLAAGLWSIDPWPHFLLSRCSQEQEALSHLEQALRNQPLGMFYREKARHLLKNNETLAAQEAIDKALQISPYDDVSWHLCSLLCHQEQRLQAAEHAIRQACQLKPLNSLYRQQWISLLQAMGAHDTAAQLHCFAMGQPARLSRVFTRSDHLEPQLQPPGAWQWKLAQNPSLEQLQKGCEVWNPESQQRGYLKYLAVNNLQMKQQLLEQIEAIPPLHQAYPTGFTPLLDHYDLGHHMALIYAYQDGDNLAMQLQKQDFVISDWPALAQQAIHLLRVLESQQVFHGDITPANLIWHQGHLTLVDYENLHRLPCNSLRNYQVTPEYAAPEFWKGHQASFSADHYSMALVLLEMATGIFPDLCRHWQAHDFSGFRQYTLHLPAPLIDHLVSACHWDSAQRKALDSSLFNLPIRREPTEHLPRFVSLLREIACTEEHEKLKTLSKALLNIESGISSYYHLAYHALRLEHWEMAQKTAHHCLRLAPHHVGALWIMADVFMAKEHWSQALVHLQKALAYGPDEPESYRRLLKIYCHQHNIRLALAACNHLVRCLPFHSSARLEQAMTLAYFGLNRQAATLLEQLPPALRPPNPQAQNTQ